MPSTPFKLWSLFTVATVIAVWILAQLPSFDHQLQQRRQAVAVFQPNSMRLLTDENLVDSISRLPLQDQLVKVGWDHAILTIDLLGFIPDEVWEDISRFIVFAYADVTNVKQVLVRVYRDNNHNRALLMAVETRKSEWTEKELAALRQTSTYESLQQSSKIRLSLTSSGKRWLANFAN